MPKLEVLIGTRFGRLTVVGEAEPVAYPSGKLARRLECDCDCGSEVAVLLSNLRSWHTQSCGCLSAELSAGRSTTHGQTKKGLESANYRLWCSIKRRVVTGSDPKAYYWKGRGITMYEPWITDFIAFDTWINENLGPRPKRYSLDRIDNDGNYEPGNLQWALARVQNNNKQNNVWITLNGETHTIAQWAEKQGLNYGTLQQRISRDHWPVEKALTTPVRRSNSAN